MWWMLLTVALAQEAWPSRACDIPAPDLAAAPAESAEACEARCRERADCQGYTFVSGWDRCKLEAGGKPIGVRMTAARLQPGENRQLGPPQADHDHTGKDLEPQPRDLPSAEACATACLGEVRCQGYVYVEGYRACWFKAADAPLQQKRFTCALRPTAG